MSRGQDWDPTAPETARDPHSTHARMRHECPVAHSNKWGGFWTLTRYADICAATTDKRNFSAKPQTIVPASPRKGLPRLPLQADPPEHTAYRRALNPYFTEAKVAALEPALRSLARRLLAAIRATDRPEMVAAYTGAFATQSLCAFAGLQPDEAIKLKTLSDDYVRAVQALDHATAGPISQAVDQLAVDLVADRKRRPRDPKTDMTSGLLAARHRFTDTEVAGMIRLLLIGGHTVTANFLGSAIRHLAQHPALQSELRRAPAQLPAAIEELLRLYSPNQALVRTTTRDVTIRGETIPAGQPVAMLYISGNRDAEMFDDPDAFRLDRPPHIAFGHGIHKCIGQALARLQALVAVSELLAATSDFTIDGPVRPSIWPEYGVAEMRLHIGWV